MHRFYRLGFCVAAAIIVSAFNSFGQCAGKFGNPLKIARQLGVDVPRIEMLYALTKALDEAVAHRQPGKSLAGDEVASNANANGPS